MATPLTGRLALVEGESIRVVQTDSPTVEALIYRAYGMMILNLPPVPDEVQSLLDDPDAVAQLRDHLGLQDYGLDEEPWAVLNQWPLLVRPGEFNEDQREIVVKMKGAWTPASPVVPCPVSLETDVEGADPLRWPATIIWYLTRPGLAPNSVETLVGLRWSRDEVPAI